MDTKNEFAFPVEKAPVFVHGAEVKDKLAIWRPDTKAVLGIVSNKYEVITHSQAIEGFRLALADTEHTEKVDVIRGGAFMYATYTLKQHVVEVKKGDIVGLQFTVKNSYDGSTTLGISLGALRLVCTNGMVLGQRFYAYSQRHFGQNAGVNVAELAEKIGILAEKFQATLPAMQQMAATQFTGNFADEALAKKLPEYLLEVAEAEFKKGGDGSNWGFYNALTFAISHHMRRQSPVSQLRYGRIAWTLANMEATGAHLS